MFHQEASAKTIKIKENATIRVTYQSNEDKITREKSDYWKKLDFAIQGAKDKLIIVVYLNTRVGKRDEESSFMVGNQGEFVRDKKRTKVDKLLHTKWVDNCEHIF